MRRWQAALTLSLLMVLSCFLWARTPVRPGLLLIAVKGDQSVGIVDSNTNEKLAEVPEGGVTGHELTVSPDGRTAYVPIYGNAGVGEPGTDGHNMVVIDLASRKVIGNVDFGKGVRPHCPVFGPKNGLLYVTTELNRSVTIIDPKTLRIIGSVPTDQDQSHMLVISRDGHRGYKPMSGREPCRFWTLTRARQSRSSLSWPGLTYRNVGRRQQGVHLRPDKTSAGRDRYRHQ